MLRCQECGAHTNTRGETFTAESLKLHRIKAHKTANNGTPVPCDICGQSVSNDGKPFNASSMLMHRRKAHPRVAPASAPVSAGEFQCAICGVTRNRRGQPFRDQEEVLRHQRAAHGRADRAQSPKPPRNGSSGEMGSNGGFSPSRSARFCPDCGCNLEVIHAALSLTSGEGL